MASFRRARSHGQLPWQSTNAGRAAHGPEEGFQPHPASTGLAPRNLRGLSGARGAQRPGDEALPALDRLGYSGSGIAPDFNGTFFSHPLAADGYTLAHPDPGIRRFWVEHGIASRHIAADMGRAQGEPLHQQHLDPRRREGSSCGPLGAAPAPGGVARRDVCRGSCRPNSRATPSNPSCLASAPSPTWSARWSSTCHMPSVGRRSSPSIWATSTSTEEVSDKISSVLTFIDEVLFHVSRGVRWDSDHVVTSRIRCAPSPRSPCAAMSLDRGTLPGLFRCQHQPDRGMGHRRALPEGAPHRPRRAHAAAGRRWSSMATAPAAWH